MIRYPTTLKDIENEVAAIDPKWLSKAAKRSVKLIKAGKYVEASSIWSVVKPVFMKVQKNKCLFCERQFESEKYGKIEFDLEHFRPKGAVRKWPESAGVPPYAFETGDAADGYYWLAYSLANYAACCKACNTTLKSSYFPIAGSRAGLAGNLPAEQPFLCYPIGSSDADPEDLVTFVGIVAVPAAQVGHDRRRGQVIIDFFDLNRRDTLEQQRATMIMLLGNALVAVDDGTGGPEDHEIIQACLKAHMPHAGCLRAFYRQWNTDKAYARDLHRLAKKRFLASA